MTKLRSPLNPLIDDFKNGTEEKIGSSMTALWRLSKENQELKNNIIVPLNILEKYMHHKNPILRQKVAKLLSVTHRRNAAFW